MPWWLMAQSNYNLENFGNKSILLSGNVTGSVEDLGLTYYNPARIAIVENPVFSINAKGYQLNQYKLKNAFGLNRNLSSSDFQGVPSMVAGTFKIKKLEEKHLFAYSFLSRTRSNLDLGYSTDDISLNNLDEIDRLANNIRLKNKISDEWFGITWGMKIKDNFSVGISGFASIYSARSSNDVHYASIDDNGTVKQYNNEISYGQNSYGLFWKLGLAYIFPKFELGLNIDLPYIEVVSNGRFSYQEFLSGFGEPTDIFEYYKYEGLNAQRKEPLGISVGAGIPLKKSKIHLKLDWHNGVPSYHKITIPSSESDIDEISQFQFVEELNQVFNFGAGGEFFINDKYSAYASFSTDFSAVKNNANIFDVVDDESTDVNLSANFFHLAGGMDMSLKWGHLVFGVTYSHGHSSFQHNNYPKILDVDDVLKNNADIDYTRWRFIIGLDIPIFNYNLRFQ